MSKISQRVKLYNYYINILDSDKIMKKIFNKVEILGEGGQGKVFKYCEKKKCNKSLVIKKIYLNLKESKYVDDIFNMKAFKNGVFIELSSFYLVNELVLQQISPNFIINYEYEFIERNNSICDDIYPYTGYFYNEFIDHSSTFTEWVNDTHDIELWYNALFQIMTALYCLQKYFNMIHLDLHTDNIIVKKIKPGGYWSYIINNKKYKLPNLGYVFYINDFGHAYIPRVFQSWFVNKRYNKKDIHKGFDIYQLLKSTLKVSSPPKKFVKIVRYIIKTLKKKDSDFVALIEEIWGDMTTANKVKIETYNMDKVITTERIPDELHFLVN